jgi:putative transposase
LALILDILAYRRLVSVLAHRAPWKTKEALELATLEWVAWFNHHRPLSTIGYTPPAEAEVNYYRQLAGQSETKVST